MLTPEHVDPASVIEPNFFSNWGDLWYPRLANRLLTPASKMSTLTPNRVTIASFVLYIVAAGLIIVGGAWSVLGAVPDILTIPFIPFQFQRNFPHQILNESGVGVRLFGHEFFILAL